MRAAALALLMALAIAAPSWAQAPVPDIAGDVAASGPAPAQDAAPAVDASKLGVSLSRIQRGLRVSESREQFSASSPFKLEYQIQVYGAAPRIDILKDFDVSPTAPLSYGAPTHREFLNHWTPQAFRSPRWPVGELAGWALFQVAKRADKSKCEQEIQDYRALVMRGISAPAPRCTQ